MREQACPKRFEDYEVHVTVEEKDEFMLTTCADDDVVSTDKNDGRAIEAVAHYIMMHYEEKEKLKKRKKKYKPNDGQYSLDAGLCHFGDRQRRQSQKSCISSTLMRSLSQSWRIA